MTAKLGSSCDSVLSQTITVPIVGGSAGFTSVQNYTYDELNRIQQADEKPSGWANCTSDPTKCWTQTFTYDRYGNRNFVEATTTTLPKNCGTTPNFTVCTPDIPIVNPIPITASNKLTGYNYDASGNTTEDAEEREFVYDAENKQIEVIDNSVTVGEYFYDGDGKRIKKEVPGGETTIFVYDAGGKLIQEHSTVVQTGGNAKTTYPTADSLGSPRINTDGVGNALSRHDYHPFGEEVARSGYGSDTIRKQFTGYERDGETGLDFAQARYHNSSLGRFSSADPLFFKEERLADPQQLNLYLYVRNNPLNLIDPSGLDFEFTGKDKKKFVGDVNNRSDAQFQVKLNKEGIVEVVDKDKIDVSKLSKAEKTFFDAINNTDNRATLNGVSKDASFEFGGFKGNGRNDIDASDMALLRKADKTFAGDVVSHEMMEAYASAKSPGSTWKTAHPEASKTFPGANVEAQPLPGEGDKPVVSGAMIDYTISRNGKSRTVTATYAFVNKLDLENTTSQTLPTGHITKVRKKR